MNEVIDMRGEASNKDASLSIAYMAPQIGVLSGTFVYRDVEGLRAQGAEVTLFSLRRPIQEVTSAEAEEFIRETQYLYDHGLAVFLGAAFRQMQRRPGVFFRVMGMALRDVFCAKTSSMKGQLTLFWHFLMGCCLAERLAACGAQHIHSNFAHAPATVAMYAAALQGIPFSFLCHAHDIFVRPTAMKEKAARAAFGMCSSNYNVRHLVDGLGCAPDKLHVMHTGVDLRRFSCRPWRPVQTPLRLLSVGRLVEKKGYCVLVAALGLLAGRGRTFTAHIVGGGPLLEPLRQQIAEMGLQDRVQITGALPQEEVRRHFDQADVFVLACLEAKDKDMDGTPIVLIESMALGVPVVSTGVSGIPELITHGVSGVLAKPGDPESLAAALEDLMDHPDAMQPMVVAARETIERGFDLESNIVWLMRHVREAVKAG